MAVGTNTAANVACHGGKAQSSAEYTMDWGKRYRDWAEAARAEAVAAQALPGRIDAVFAALGGA